MTEDELTVLNDAATHEAVKVARKSSERRPRRRL